jgi:hypothetical protein
MPQQPSRMMWRFAAAFAIVLCVAALTFGTALVHRRNERLDGLRAERRRIESELQQVKAVAGDPRAVVVLENADTRVIVPVADRRPAQNAQNTIMY